MHTCKLIAAFSALLIASLSVGCEGFFVDPVLTGVSVGPAATIQTGTTMQMTALGTYNDGSQKKLTSGMYWNSGSPNIASVSTSGLVRGIAPGQSVISGSAESVSGSATVTVIIGGLTNIQIRSQDGFTNITYGSSEQFIATGTANGVPIDVTNSVTWSTNPQVINNVSIDSNTGLLTTTSGGTALVQFEVTATDPTTGMSDTLNFTVHP